MTPRPAPSGTSKRDVAQRPDRRVDLAARRAVHVVRPAAQPVDARRDQIDDRPRAARRDSAWMTLLELNGDVAASLDHVREILVHPLEHDERADEQHQRHRRRRSATSVQSGARPNTSDDAEALDDRAERVQDEQQPEPRGHRDSGYATGVRYSHSCSAICTTGLTSR